MSIYTINLREKGFSYIKITPLPYNRKLTWKFLLKILIFEVLSLTAYSPSDDQTNSKAEPNDRFLHAKAVYMMYSPSPQTTTNLPFGLCFKL